jgi:hypothetical protein
MPPRDVAMMCQAIRMPMLMAWHGNIQAVRAQFTPGFDDPPDAELYLCFWFSSLRCCAVYFFGRH